MDKYQTIGFLYRNLVRPVAFRLDAERVHNSVTWLGEKLENWGPVLEKIFAYRDEKLEKEVLGVKFPNPVGLAAGFDYDGHLAQAMKHVGFGFNTVGTVTAKPYLGNPGPRLLRLPKSQSLLVNKGFKSEGAVAVAARLDKKDLSGHTIGISVGSTNSPKVNTINKAIDDYLFTFDLFSRKPYVKYFELNISCPNTAMTESFTVPKNFKTLVKACGSLCQPIFVKMPNEILSEGAESLVKIAVLLGVRGFIFSNLVKDRNNSCLNRAEIEKIRCHRGNFSGRPTTAGALRLISYVRQKFGRNVAIVGCGGIFCLEDAKNKFTAGADLVQLITGMIYEGPQVVGSICRQFLLPYHINYPQKH